MADDFVADIAFGIGFMLWITALAYVLEGGSFIGCTGNFAAGSLAMGRTITNRALEEGGLQVSVALVALFGLRFGWADIVLIGYSFGLLILVDVVRFFIINFLILGKALWAAPELVGPCLLEIDTRTF